MRRRFQKGYLQKVRGVWVARWREDGQRKARKLGRVSLMTKAQALTELAAIVGPINSRRGQPSEQMSFGDFVQQVYLPFYRRKWKRSTAMTNEDRIAHHLTPEFAPRSLRSFGRDELQSILDRKARTLSFSVVDHLRWDLKQIFDMSVAEGYLRRNPAALLFTSRECKRSAKRIMTLDEVRRLFSLLDIRERLIAKLVVLAGMRPGEIFGLKWKRLGSELRRYPAARVSWRCGLPKVRAIGPIRGAFQRAARFHRPVAGAVARCACRRVGIPVGETHDASVKGQLLEAKFPAKARTGRTGLGKLPGHAAHSQLSLEGAGCRSPCEGRADGAYR